MIKNLDELQKLGKENVEATLKVFGAASKGAQAIAMEVADYSKKSFEEGTQAIEKLLGAKSLESAIQVQQDYLRAAYEGFVSQSTQLGALYADVAKETYKPLEAAAAKVSGK